MSDQEYSIDIRDIEPLSPDEVKVPDRKKGYPLTVPRWYTKLFEKVPGLMTWFLLLLPIILSLTGYPQVMVVYVAFLTVYWSYRGALFAYGLITGYRRMRRDLETDFVSLIEEMGEKPMKYVYICPIVKEGMATLDPAIKMFAEQDIGAKNISIIFALEEKYKDISVPNCETLIARYKEDFREISYIVHPQGIPGEVAGVKGANINWATRHFVKLIEKRGEKMEEYLLITCDSDMRPHEKYLSAITHKYYTTENKLRTFYSTAVHTFSNNIWNVPPINRVFAHSLTLAIFHAWVVQKHFRDTWSSYVVNLKTVHEVGYWDPEVGIDDTTFYWNAAIRFKGEFSGEEVYIPTYNDAVENKNFVDSHKALYKQQLRWGWGIIVFPITMAGLYKNNDIPFLRKINMLLMLIHNQLLFLTVIYTITLSTPIMNILSPEFQYSSASYNLSKVMSYILTALMFLNIPVYIIRNKLTPQPNEWKLWRRVIDLFEIALITVNMLTFGFIPKIHAQTEMLFNKFRDKYYATEKVAIEKKK